MRLIVCLSALLIFSSNAMSACQVIIPEKDFLHDSGYSLTFDFTKLLNDNGYVETYDASKADYELRLEGIERVTPRFHHAVGKLELIAYNGDGDYVAAESILCFTQFCGISDYARAFNKSYKKLNRALPHCLNGSVLE